MAFHGRAQSVRPRLVTFGTFCLAVGTRTVLLPQAALAGTVSSQIDNNAATYSVGGTVSGLSGTVVLYDNDGDDLSDSASGGFTFATGLTTGSAYKLTGGAHPRGPTRAGAGPT